MTAFQYQSVLLHQLPESQGWHIVGVKPDRSREQIALLVPTVEDWLAQLLADIVAQNMAGNQSAEID